MIDPIESREQFEPARTSSMFHDVLLGHDRRAGRPCAARRRLVRDLSRFGRCGRIVDRRLLRSWARKICRHGQDAPNRPRGGRQRERSLVFANAGRPPPLMTGPFGALYLEYAEADLPLGIVEDITPALRVVSVPARTPLVFYTDGVSEGGRKPVEGEAQLRHAAQFAYMVAHVAAPEVIVRQMFLMGSNADDAAIVTARTLGTPIVRRPPTPYERADDYVCSVERRFLRTTRRPPS